MSTNCMPKIFLVIALLTAVCNAQSGNGRTGMVRTIVSETPAIGSINLGGLNIEYAGTSRVDHYLDEGANGFWSKLPPSEKWRKFSGKTVRISERPSKDVEVEVLSASPLWQPTTGMYKTVAVLLTIVPTNTTAAPMNVSPAMVRNSLYDSANSVDRFYREASFGAFGFRGVNSPTSETFSYIIQTAISSECQQQIVSEFTSSVRQSLLGNGINTYDGTVDLGIIIFNDVAGCPPYPFATRGELGARGVPLWMWIPTSWFTTGSQIVTHEIGHALGNNHPASIHCSDWNNTSTCSVVDSSDRDIMASAGRYGMLPNNFERRRWGWHSENAFSAGSLISTELLDLLSPRSVSPRTRLNRRRYLNFSLNGPWAGWQVFPEARSNIGVFDQFNGTDAKYRRGVTLRLGHSYYIDPDTTSFLINDSGGDDADAPLMPGETFSFGGVRITPTLEWNPRTGTRISIGTEPSN